MKQIEPTDTNSKILSDMLAIKIKKGLEERYPTAEQLLEESQ